VLHSRGDIFWPQFVISLSSRAVHSVLIRLILMLASVGGLGYTLKGAQIRKIRLSTRPLPAAVQQHQTFYIWR
jgi:hypothetical protein